MRGILRTLCYIYSENQKEACLMKFAAFNNHTAKRSLFKDFIGNCVLAHHNKRHYQLFAK
jgi:hypothetical protein